MPRAPQGRTRPPGPARRRLRAALLGGGLLGGVLAAAALGLAPGGSAWAQDGGQGSARELTLGVSSSLSANTNRTLDPDDALSSTRAGLRFSLAYADVTPIQSFRLTGGVGLRQVWEDDAEDEDALDGLAEPDLRLSFERAVPDTRIAATARVGRELVSFLEPIDDLLESPGDPLLDPSDLLGGDEREGSLLRLGGDVELELWRTAPVGLELSAGVALRRYQDVTDPDLTDSDRARVGASLRFTLDPVTRARIGLRHSRVEEEETGAGEAGDSRTTALVGSLTRETPLGSIGVDGSVDDTEDGERYTLALDYATRLPLWSLSSRAGLSRGTAGDLSFVGSLRAERELIDGALSITVDQRLRSIGSDGEDVEEEALVSGLRVGYTKQVNPLLGLTADASLLRTDPTGDDAAETVASAGIGLQRQLTRDWTVNLGLRHRYRDDEGGGAHDNSVSLSLGRSFAFRP
jgi:hypothetical protein